MQAPQLEEAFERLQHEATLEFQEALRLEAESLVRRKEREKVHFHRIHTQAQAIGLDLKQIHQAEAEALKPYLDQVRPSLVNRKSMAKADLHLRAITRAHLEKSGFRQAEHLGVQLLSSAKEEKPGQHRRALSSIIVPNLSGEIKAGISQEGDGSGGAATEMAQEAAHAYFHFRPTSAGCITINALPIFHGFFHLKADETYFTSKSAEVSLTFRIDVIQHGIRQRGPTIPIFSKSGSNVDQSAFIDQTTQTYSRMAIIQAGEPVFIDIELGLSAGARGAGSYAELNFSCGEANYISIPCVVICPGMGLG